MKNLQLFKRGISLLTTGVVLVSLVGCRKNSNTSVEAEENEDLCHHFSVRVGDEYETYKECDGYDLDIIVGGQTGTCYFEISRDDKLLLDGTAKIEVKIMDGDACLSMYKNIYVDKNTRELSLQPNWDISQESLMQELPVSGETEVVIYYEVLDGKLILSNKSTKIIIKNDRKLRKMTLKLQ